MPEIEFSATDIHLSAPGTGRGGHVKQARRDRENALVSIFFFLPRPVPVERDFDSDVSVCRANSFRIRVRLFIVARPRIAYKSVRKKRAQTDVTDVCFPFDFHAGGGEDDARGSILQICRCATCAAAKRSRARV